MTTDLQRPRQMEVNTGDEISRGRYSNYLIVSHSPDEFVLDWLLTSPNGNHLVSRLVLSPSNVKRAIEALTTNLKQYEERFRDQCDRPEGSLTQ